MEKAHIIGEPLQYSKNGKFDGCGVNFRFLEDANNALLNYATYSINFYVENLNVALVKTTYSKASFANSTPQSQKKKIESSWIRLNNSDPLPLLKSMKGEEDSILALAESSKSLNFLSQVIEKTPSLLLGIKEPNKSYEIIMHGSAIIKDEDKLQIASCFKELVEKYRKK